MITEKLTQLHSNEEAIRTESLNRVHASSDLSDHIAMIQSCLDLIYDLLPSNIIKSEDQLMLGNLGIRIFNAVNATLKLLLSGYYQAAALHLRDVLETTFLLDYFSIDAEFITQWRTLPEGVRIKRFRPVLIRNALDKRDGFTDKKRAEAYNLLCKLAGHASPEGVVMLVPVAGESNVHCGPFLEGTTLGAVLSELAKLAVQAALSFAQVIEGKDISQDQAHVSFINAYKRWIEKFFPIIPFAHPSGGKEKPLLAI